MSKHFDIIIIGGGPGGYIAAERAGEKGKSVLLIEKSFLGGVCLNEGCIPSKTLLYSAKLFAQAAHSEKYGVYVENARFNLADAMKRKQAIIERLRKGIAFQMKHFNVEVVEGIGAFVDRRKVQVGDDTFTADNIIISTGSSPIRPPIPGADQAHVLTSSEIFDIESLPENLVVVGGGVIGCEFASFFSNVGVNVTVVEMLPEILPPIDPEYGKMLRGAMRPVKFQVGSKVEAIGDGDVTFSKDGKSTTIPADMVLMSIGRKPNIAGLRLEKIGVDVDRTGIKVNDKMQTNVPGIYAVGDVNGKSMLAHSASRMGEVAVNNIAGEADVMRYCAIPGVVYTYPEIAVVGLTEAQAEEQGIPVKASTIHMNVNGRFLAENEGKRGMCKVVVHAETDVLLGVHMFGAASSEIIFGAAAMIEDEFRVQDIKEVIFPHPTVSEVFKDAFYGLPE